MKQKIMLDTEGGFDDKTLDEMIESLGLERIPPLPLTFDQIKEFCERNEIGENKQRVFFIDYSSSMLPLDKAETI